MLCPDCETQIKVSKVGIQSYYKQHKNSAQCDVNKKKKKKEDTIQKIKQSTSNFFRPKLPAVPTTVRAPTPVYPYTSTSPIGIESPTTLASSPSLKGGKADHLINKV